jgi:lipoyl(octanoyl) transferase
MIRKNIGIWVKDKKIAAIGIRVSRWVAYHGCSINISNNLNQYLKIIPCGLDNKKGYFNIRINFRLNLKNMRII